MAKKASKMENRLDALECADVFLHSRGETANVTLTPQTGADRSIAGEVVRDLTAAGIASAAHVAKTAAKALDAPNGASEAFRESLQGLEALARSLKGDARAHSLVVVR